MYPTYFIISLKKESLNTDPNQEQKQLRTVSSYHLISCLVSLDI